MKIKFILYGLFMLVLGVMLVLPDVTFDQPFSKVIFDRNGTLLSAKTSTQGQWHFPKTDSLPEQFTLPVIAFEDKRFFHHRGVDVQAIGRAVIQNIKAGRIVSGASTISMQVVRMSRPGTSRTIIQKIYESLLAIKLELNGSKKEILELYSTHAPLGGNVIGVEAASWRYFKKPLTNITWAEGAMLAVLPNAPSLIHLGKNRDLLKAKRDRLLSKLFAEHVIDKLEYETALLEPIPENPHLLPKLASHIMESLGQKQSKFTTNIDYYYQHRISSILDLHANINSKKEIYNGGVIVADNTSGKILAYVGNASGTHHENYVDMVIAKRSSGSILKPLLYGMMLNEGKISPHQMVPDTPISIDGFNPKNYNKAFSGSIKASEALVKSLNIPAVLMLQDYGVGPFRDHLIEMGISSLSFEPDHYGLSLILGGGEVTLLDLVNVYSRMAQKLNLYYDDNVAREISLVGNGDFADINLDEGVIYSVFNAMRNLSRPNAYGGWENFTSSLPIGWKTGTSYGHRDAWAVGITPQYTIGVWVGNSDGEGRPEIIGSNLAGSLMFDVFSALPNNGKWFDIPHDYLIEVPTCVSSGYPAGPSCDKLDTILSPRASLWVEPCPYHMVAYVDDNGERVHLACEQDVNKKSYFILPPDMAYYYRKNHSDYQELPPYRTDCNGNESKNTMAILYPSSSVSLFLPKGLNGKKNYPIFKASHKDDKAKIFWHLDDDYIGSTEEIHEMKIKVLPGNHKISLVDINGNVVSRTFEVVGE